jgi:hypothetical protein
MDALLGELQLNIERRKPDRDPLTEYMELQRTQSQEPARASTLASGRSRGAITRIAWKTAVHTKRLVMPAALAASLMVLALVRLPSANTAWTEQLTVNSNVGTGEFKCDPVKLEFVEAAKVGSDTKFVYALSGGGGTGPKCQDTAIASVSIPVCFDPAMKPGGDVVAESHPGNVAASWKAGTSPKQVTWNAVTTTAPLGGKGPFDPAQMRFSFTLTGTVALSPLPVHAALKAGPDEADAGAVRVPACPLPSAAAQKASSDPAPPADAPAAPPTSTPSPTPKPATAPVGPAVGGRGSGSGGAAGTVKPTATPTPLGVMVW